MTFADNFTSSADSKTNFPMYDMESVFSSCSQSSISKQQLTKMLSHSSSLVKYYGILLCLELFDKFTRVKDSHFLNGPDIVDDFIVQFHRRLPDYQTIIAIYNSFLSPNTPNCPLIQSTTLQLVKYYISHFDKTFSELKFDPFKFLIEKYNTISYVELVNLIPLLTSFKLLEKRNGKTILWYIFGLLRKDENIFERVVDLINDNNEFISAFVNIEDLYFIAEELSICSEEKFNQFTSTLENFYSEYFKSKGTNKISRTHYEKFIGKRMDYLKKAPSTSSIEKLCSFFGKKIISYSYLSAPFIRISIEFLLKIVESSGSSSLLLILFQISKRKNILPMIIPVVFDNPLVVQSFLDGKKHFVEIVNVLAKYSRNTQDTKLAISLSDQIRLSIANNMEITDSWASILCLANTSITDKKFVNLVIFPSEYFSNPEHIQMYFENFLRCSAKNLSIGKYNLFLLHIMHHIPEPFKLFKLLIQVQKNEYIEMIKKIISFDYQSLSYAVRNNCSLFLESNESTMNVEMSEKLSFKFNPKIADEEKLEIASNYNGTSSSEDLEIFNLICQYERNGIYFGDFLIFFGSNVSKHQQRVSYPSISVLLTQAISSLDFRLLKQSINAFPLLDLSASNRHLYNPHFISYWIFTILDLASKNQVYSQEFVQLFIESNCLSFLCVCQCSPDNEILKLTSHCLYLFDIIFSNFTRDSSRNFEFFSLALDSLRQIMPTSNTSQNIISEHQTGISSNSPNLNSFFAHFFAKLFEILQTPSHLMFPWICKLLLKKPYLAMDNIYTFIDLLWSNEKVCRIWVLELLRDGLKDESSFRLYKNCRVLQFCMNSYDASHCYLDGSHRDLFLGVVENAVTVSPVEMLVYDGIQSWLLGQIKIAFDNKFSAIMLLKIASKLLNSLNGKNISGSSSTEDVANSSMVITNGHGELSANSDISYKFAFQLDQFCSIVRECLKLREFNIALEMLNVLIDFGLKDQLRFVINPLVIREISVNCGSACFLKRILQLHAEKEFESDLACIYRTISTGQYA